MAGAPLISPPVPAPSHTKPRATDGPARPGVEHMKRYGSAHQRLRAKWAPIVATGEVKCWRCNEPIGPDEAWDLGHGDGQARDQYRGPEHRGRCNRATATHLAAARRRPQPPHPGKIGDTP